MSDAWRERVATILEIIARDRLPNPHDLDVALDAIECETADEIERLHHELTIARLDRDHARRLAAEARREGIGAAASELRAIAARMRRMDLVDLQVLSNAATLEQAADALAELPAARNPTGLEYRGG
jgi:hypothetical protein